MLNSPTTRTINKRIQIIIIKPPKLINNVTRHTARLIKDVERLISRSLGVKRLKPLAESLKKTTIRPENFKISRIKIFHY